MSSNWHAPDDPAFPFFLDEFIFNDEDKKRRQQHDEFTKRNGNNDQGQRNVIERDDDFDDDEADEEAGGGAFGRSGREPDDDEDFDDEDDFDSDDDNDSGGSGRPVNLTSNKPVMSSPSPSTGFVALALVTAILHGKLDEIRSLLKDNPNWVNAKDGKGLTPLHYAVAVDNLEIVKLLVGRWATFNVKNNAGFTPLDVARTRKSTAIVEYFEDIDATASPLFNAIRNGSLNRVCYFLHYYPHWINVKDGTGWTPLHWAVNEGNIEIVQFLVSKGADVNVKDNDGLPPLHLAAHFGNIDVVKFLILHGVDMHAKDDNGFTPLAHAKAYAEDSGVVEYLTAVPLFDAIKSGQLNEVRTLLKNNPQWITAEDQDRITPLHHAVLKNKVEIVKYLILEGAEVNAKDDWGFTPLHSACYCPSDNVEVMQCLISAGADINVHAAEGFDGYGCTPLELAAREGSIEAVKYFVSLGVIDKANDIGVSAVSWALAANKYDIARFLISKGVSVDTQDYYKFLIENIDGRDYEETESLLSLQADHSELLPNLRDIIRTRACTLLEEAAICDTKMADLVLKYVGEFINNHQVEKIMAKDFSKEREKRKKEKQEKLEQFWKQL